MQFEIFIGFAIIRYHATGETSSHSLLKTSPTIEVYNCKRITHF